MERVSQDKIDRYLRGEMTDSEIRQFENEVVRDSGLCDDLEITYILKRSLGKRQQKLYQTSKWRHKKQRTVLFTSISMVAACLATCLIFFKPSSILNNPENGFVAMTDTTSVQNENVVDNPSAMDKKTNSKYLLAEAKNISNDVEHQNPSVSLSQPEKVSVMSHKSESKSINITLLSDYEQEWSNILSHLKVWNDSVLIEHLIAFSKLDGAHKEEADSILIDLFNE